ncbi:homocysteine S-methyltransferase [Acidipila sp. EB88]|uniref:homocysteine S-methyltransferase n=1 Tax=Acidipila sp. EB88 TaxID=2305226 RepID=UPI000F603BB4|nr:homocysteine S-methyltransferase [Acidipila sp. EB88]RRA48078.1 homocysteine S-methyltransferase [Acidipila sp. EB88]
MRSFATLDLRDSRVLDGGLATELERHGVATAGPLWSARALVEAPGVVLAVHRAYLEAGADILLTASYQVSSMGFAAEGLGPADAQRAAADALRRSVALAVQARAGRTGILVAASLGPYGAALANGAEFHGNYGFASEAEQHAVLVRFHAERIRVLLGTEADLLAFETLPSLAEARAIVEALAVVAGDAPSAQPGAWLSFCCLDAAHTAHGELLQECAGFLGGVPAVLAVGVNCTAPALIGPLLQALRAGTAKPLLAYPNSGEGWDAEHRCWTGVADVQGYESLARDWYRQGAQVVGGCCRTGPDHVRAVRRAAVAAAD